MVLLSTLEKIESIALQLIFVCLMIILIIIEYPFFGNKYRWRRIIRTRRVIKEDRAAIYCNQLIHG